MNPRFLARIAVLRLTLLFPRLALLLWTVLFRLNPHLPQLSFPMSFAKLVRNEYRNQNRSSLDAFPQLVIDAVLTSLTLHAIALQKR